MSGHRWRQYDLEVSCQDCGEPPWAGVPCPGPHRLAPMVDRIGAVAIEHGARSVILDPDHPLACLCGAPDYLMCDAPGTRVRDMIIGGRGPGQ